MIIDLILDRKQGVKQYQPKAFYNDVMQYCNSMPDIAGPIADALDSGTENDVRRELRNYIMEQGYNLDLCKYISIVNWLND